MTKMKYLPFSQVSTEVKDSTLAEIPRRQEASLAVVEHGMEMDEERGNTCNTFNVSQHAVV